MVENTCLNFIIFGVLIFLPQGQCSIYTQTTFAPYEIVPRYPRALRDFAYWSQQCRAKGPGWAPAVISSDEEMEFISANLRHRGYRGELFIGSFFAAAEVVIDGYFCEEENRNLYELQTVEKNYATNRILCELSGMSFQTETSLYFKAVDFSRHDYKSQNKHYGYFEKHWCRGLGYGWDPATINTQEELDYIYTQQQEWGDDHSYWVGGSVLSDGSKVFTFNYSDYRPNQTYPVCCGHIQPVFISTWGDGGYDRMNFQLAAGTYPVKTALDGVLCENAAYIFRTNTSRYRRLGSTRYVQFDYNYWSAKCSELGFRWHPAIVDDTEELEFIAEQSRGLLETWDWYVYWIGGLGYDSLEAHGYSEDTHVWWLSIDFQNNVNEKNEWYPDIIAHEEIHSKSKKIHSILCENTIPYRNQHEDTFHNQDRFCD